MSEKSTSESSPARCLAASRLAMANWRLVNGLLKISSALTLAGAPRRDDHTDCFFVIFLCPLGKHHEQHRQIRHSTDDLPALLAGSSVDTIAADQRERISEYPACEFKIDAVLLAVFLILRPRATRNAPRIYILSYRRSARGAGQAKAS